MCFQRERFRSENDLGQVGIRLDSRGDTQMTAEASTDGRAQLRAAAAALRPLRWSKSPKGTRQTHLIGPSEAALDVADPLGGFLEA